MTIILNKNHGQSCVIVEMNVGSVKITCSQTDFKKHVWPIKSVIVLNLWPGLDAPPPIKVDEP